MKKFSAFAPFIALTFILSIVSCKKDSSNNTPTTPSNAAPTVHTPGDANGAFVALNTINKISVPIIGEIDQNLGTAVGWFGDTATFVDGGTVKCNDSLLTKQSNNAYIYGVNSTGSTSATLGLTFAGAVSWDISGNGTNAVPAFTYTHAGSFPAVGNITNSSDVETTSDFTLNVSSTAYADSVYFAVIGPDSAIYKLKPNGTTSCYFTAAEMATVGKGDNLGFLQVAPYSYVGQTFSGKTYYFIKESVITKSISLK